MAVWYLELEMGTLENNTSLLYWQVCHNKNSNKVFREVLKNKEDHVTKSTNIESSVRQQCVV